MLHTHYTFHIWNITKFTTWFASNPASSALILLEGSQTCLTVWWQQLSSYPFCRRCNLGAIAKTRLQSFRSLPGLLWHKLYHHSDCVGASNFSYQIGISPSLSWQSLSSTETPWELKDILEVTHGGFDCPPPGRSPYLLVSRSLSALVQAPSVFSQGGWVHRHLLPSEFLRAFDVPKVLDSDLLAGLNADTWSGGDFDFNDIVSSIPGKICLRLMKHLGFSHDDSPSAPLLHDSNRSTSDSGYNSLIKGDFNLVSEQQSDVVKSVKADDAAVPIELWNRQIFAGSRFGVNYDHLVHNKPLEVIRDCWAMRWYRERLFHFFRLYMKKATT